MRSRWTIGLVLGGMLAFAAPAGAAPLDAFARCLSARGATFYGTSWCPHCRRQNETFGPSSRHLRYVECGAPAPDGSPAAECVRKGITGYPTWTFRDGSSLRGAQPLAQLAAKTGCRLPR